MTARANPRDSQRGAVYEAESLLRNLFDFSAANPGTSVDCFGVTLLLPPEAKFGDLGGVARYVDQAQHHPAVSAALGEGRPPVAVRERAGSAAAHYENAAGGPTIAVPAARSDGRWTLRELVVLHELAHHFATTAPALDGLPATRPGILNPNSGPSPMPIAAHGPEFTAAMIALVTALMGPPAGLALRIAYGELGVRVG